MTLENYFNQLKLKVVSKKKDSKLLPVVSSDNNDSVCQLYIKNGQNNVPSGSKMTVPILSGIIQRIDGIETDFSQIEYGQEDVPDKVFKEVKQGFTRNMNLITNVGIKNDQLSDGFEELRTHLNHEASIRTLIDALLFPIAEELGLKILFEQELKTLNEDKVKVLPTNILDYLIVNENIKAIGLIEAKDAGKMNENSLAQALSQLISLQKRQCLTTIFGVVTDAQHYYVMKLSGTTITLDCRISSQDPKITTVNKWDDLKIVTKMLYNLLKSGEGGGSASGGSERGGNDGG